MTKANRMKLAEALSVNFQMAYLQMAGNAPDHWDGVELRRLLMDCAEERFSIDMDKSRMKSYTNDRLTTPGL